MVCTQIQLANSIGLSDERAMDFVQPFWRGYEMPPLAVDGTIN